MPVDYSMVADPTRGFVQGFQFGSFIDQQRKEAEAERKAEEAQVALETTWANPTTASISDLIIRHPQVAERAKAAWAMRSEGQQKNDTRLQAELYMLTQNGQFDAAKQVMRDHIEELKNTPGREEAARIAEGGLAQYELNPKASMLSFGANLAVNAPDVWKNISEKDGESPDPLEKKYRFLIGERGQAYADQWLSEQTQDVVVGQPGAPVYRKSDIIGGSFQPGGGDPASIGDRGIVPGGAVEFTMPVQGGTFTSGIGEARSGGRKHNGQDIAAPAGTPVAPVAPGTVVAVGSDKLSGNYVKVRHADGTVSSYSHLGSVGVKRGDTVAPGASLGTVGATGNATGNVLHLRITGPGGKTIDPRAALNGAGRNAVRSKQQYDRLPKGARYLHPDGDIKVKG